MGKGKTVAEWFGKVVKWVGKHPEVIEGAATAAKETAAIVTEFKKDKKEAKEMIKTEELVHRIEALSSEQSSILDVLNNKFESMYDQYNSLTIKFDKLQLNQETFQKRTNTKVLWLCIAFGVGLAISIVLAILL